MYKNKKNGLVGSVVIAGIIIILVITTNGNINKFSKIENVFNKLVTPFQNGVMHLKNKFAGNNSFFENIDSLKTENEKLKKENEELKTQIDELQLVKAENEILRKYASLAEKYSEYTTIGAYIINKNISNLSDVFVINAGTNQGVTVNMAVITEDGLVGHVISATNNTAKVQPIIDTASSVSGLTGSSKTNVIVSGQIGSEQNLKVSTLQIEEDLILGDIVETSGLGGIYPKGITIGTIKEIIETKNITEKYAILETNVNFETLEYVLIVKNK